MQRDETTASVAKALKTLRGVSCRGRDGKGEVFFSRSPTTSHKPDTAEHRRRPFGGTKATQNQAAHAIFPAQPSSNANAPSGRIRAACCGHPTVRKPTCYLFATLWRGQMERFRRDRTCTQATGNRHHGIRQMPVFIGLDACRRAVFGAFRMEPAVGLEPTTC